MLSRSIDKEAKSAQRAKFVHLASTLLKYYVVQSYPIASMTLLFHRLSGSAESMTCGDTMSANKKNNSILSVIHPTNPPAPQKPPSAAVADYHHTKSKYSFDYADSKPEPP